MEPFGRGGGRGHGRRSQSTSPVINIFLCLKVIRLLFFKQNNYFGVLRL